MDSSNTQSRKMPSTSFANSCHVRNSSNCLSIAFQSSDKSDARTTVLSSSLLRSINRRRPLMNACISSTRSLLYSFETRLTPFTSSIQLQNADLNVVKMSGSPVFSNRHSLRWASFLALLIALWCLTNSSFQGFSEACSPGSLVFGSSTGQESFDSVALYSAVPGPCSVGAGRDNSPTSELSGLRAAEPLTSFSCAQVNIFH